MSRRTLTASSSVLLLCVSAIGLTGACRRGDSRPAQSSSQPAQTPSVRPASSQTSSPDAPRCETRCSPDKPRTAVARITWTLPEPAGEAAAFAKRMASQNIEVTVHKDGFAKGVFARMAGANESRPSAAGAPAGQSLPGLAGLVVTKVRTQRQELQEAGPGGANAPLAAREAGDQSRGVVIEIEGLEPGMNYYWRVPGASNAESSVIARCRAPICPADMRQGPGQGGGQ
jgi:hypothetical protein